MKIQAATRLVLADKEELKQRMIGLKHSLQSTPAGPEQDKIQKTIDDLKEIIRTAV